MDQNAVGKQIALLRHGKGLTQNELGERLGVSCQAVSKWERGETLPDTGILLDLAEVLETSVDHILSGGKQALAYRGRICVQDMKDGILSLRQMGERLGRDHILYRSAVNGINETMNTSIEDAFFNENVLEAFVAEAVIQNLMAGKYVDLTDVKNSFQNPHFRDVVLSHCDRYGIK